MKICCSDPDVWREEVCRHVLKLDFVFHNDAPFQASLNPVLDSDSLRVVRLRQPSGIISRDAKLSKNGPNTVTLFFADKGVTEIRHNKKTVRLGKGEATLLRNWQEGEIESRSSSEYLAVFLSPELLNLSASDLDSAIGERWPLSSGLKIIRDYIDCARRAKADTRMKEAIERHLHELVGLTAPSYRRQVACRPRRTLADSRLRAILRDLEGNFSEPDFCGLALSEKHGLSPRYIQKLFKETGASFTQHVIRLRLEAVRAGLLDPLDRRSVAELAFGAGFKDISHFNRLFRSRFGETPTSVRRRRNPA